MTAIKGPPASAPPAGPRTRIAGGDEAFICAACAIQVEIAPEPVAEAVARAASTTPSARDE
jgi:hypothetical protein